ncbi:MAG: hypothetical protein LC746_13395, partial [Acidobacteria bacterium]|nr:hypothetical protein [Acidobacteriota bacterium]
MRKGNLKRTIRRLALCCACAASLAAVGSAQRRFPPQTGGGVDRRALAPAESYSGDRFDYYTETPRGAHVASVSRPRAEMLSAIDDGLTELFRVARKNGYSSRLNYSDYTVFIARADRTRDSAGAYSPDIAVGAAQYAGSVYDKGGYVYAAGIVSSFD